VKDYTIKKSSVVDVNELKSFYKTAYFTRGSIFYENFKWFYKTSFSNETPLVLCDNEKVIGHAGVLIDNLNLNGNIHKFAWLTDLIILSKYRNFGLAHKLVNEWMNSHKNKITIPNDVALKIYKKFNWKVNLKTARFINFTILDKIFLKKIIFKDKLIKLKVHSIDKSIIKDILQIEESNIVSEGLKVIRDESWFEWRFLQCPFKENILCFQLDNQYIIAQLFKGKHKNRMHILYSTENFLDETEIFKLIKSWAADRGISFLWHISNVQNIKNNIFSKISKKIMNFAYSTPDDELSKKLDDGIKNIQAADSDSGHLILF